MRPEVSRRVVALCALGLVAFAFWPSLFGGGSLVGADIVATAPPFEAHRPADFSLENGPGDTIGIHSHWVGLTDDLRAGELGWWTPDLAGGQPTLKGGAPVFALPYVAVPAWYAPGLVAALRTLVAIGLSLGYLRSIGLTRSASLVGAVAFGFSGFMVGWMNWPQSSVAAFAPGVLWSIEGILRNPRLWRAAPLGLMGAAMVWASFPAVLIYLMVGSGAYTAARLVLGEHRDVPLGRRVRSLAGVGLAAAVVALMLAGPFVLGFQEYVGWGDTSYRTGNPDDSSAGVGYLLTAVAPAIWGSDAVGAPWFGEGNWVEFNAYVGASVAVLGLLGIVSGLRSPDGRRRSVAVGLAVFVVVGVLIAYVGGPVGVALGDVTGPLGGLMTRAKVLLSIGLAFGAALGADRLVASTENRSLRVDARNSAVVGLIAAALLTPSLWNWLDAARGRGVVRESVAASAFPLIAFVAVLAVIAARLTRRCSGRMAGGILVVVVSVELLAFMMPVPTTVSRSERLAATPAHEVAAAALAPGERLGGEGRTFFAATAQIFDLPDARGHLLKSAGYQALLREIDPRMLTRAGGGTATNPNVAIGTDPRTPLWQAMGLGAWAQFPDSVPIGSLLPADEPTVAEADLSIQRVTALAVVPDGGLRALVFDIDVLTSGFVDIQIATDDGITADQRWLEPHDTQVSVALLGEHLDVGSRVEMLVQARGVTALVPVDADGRLPVGRVAGDDGLALIRVGDVLLFDVPAAPAYVVGGALVEADPTAAARQVAAGSTVIERDVGVPGAAPDEVRTPASSMTFGRDEVIVRANSAAGGVLVVSVADYPGWRAEIDGEAAEIFTANGAFIGVAIPPGEHEVVLRFRPRHLGVSLLSLLVGILLVAGLMVSAGSRPTRAVR